MLIGICGAKRSGKNTFAELVQRELSEYITTQASWAELLKKSAYYALGMPKEIVNKDLYRLWADGFKEGHTVNIVNSVGETIHSISGREFLQFYGTEAHREIFGDNFWIEIFWSNNDFSETDFVFITDCRFDNEAQSVKDKGGIIIKIVNEKAESSIDKHDSESGISESIIDFVIENNGSISDLEIKAKEFAERITNE